MNDCVLISVKPEWCEKIASGEKTIEVRKSKPNMGTPFKVYIYQTKTGGKNGARCSGVIGEFVCDAIFRMWPVSAAEEGLVGYHGLSSVGFASTCLDQGQLCEYGNWKILWGWSISNLVIYNKPKELRKFKRYPVLRNDAEWIVPEQVKRPPQSWCYVEELKDSECETEALPVLRRKSANPQ